MSARAFVWPGVAALLVLQWLWHGWWMPPHGAWSWPYVAFFCLPLLPAIGLALCRHRAATFAAALAALLYFCHGVMEAMSAPTERRLALAELMLSIGVILAYSWPGVHGRFRKRTSPPK